MLAFLLISSVAIGEWGSVDVKDLFAIMVAIDTIYNDTEKKITHPFGWALSDWKRVR